MIKKLFITLLLISVIASNFILLSTVNKNQEITELKKRILDIENTNALIDIYSNLFNELIPANAK